MNQTPSAIRSGSTRAAPPPRRWPAARLRIHAHLQRRRAVRLYIVQRQLQRGKPVLPHHDVRRVLHAAEIPVLRINPFEQRVAGEPDVDPRLDALHEILVAERPRHGVLTGHKGDDILSANHRRRCGGGIGGRPLQEAVRRQPDPERAHLGAAIRRLVLDDVARNGPDAALPRRGAEAAGAAASRRNLIIDAHELLPHRGRGIVHRHHVLRDREPRPWPTRRKRLAGRIDRSGAGVLQRLESRGAHGGRRRVDHGAGILRGILGGILGAGLERQDSAGNSAGGNGDPQQLFLQGRAYVRLRLIGKRHYVTAYLSTVSSNSRVHISASSSERIGSA